MRLDPEDFEVYRTELLTQSATVLMLDMSRSMLLRGCFLAAKKVALALNHLIRTQFPRDALYIVGFSAYARELKPEALPQIDWGEYEYGTNLQHALMLARTLLARHKTQNKQIIVITDGEPTAHLEDGQSYFNYPPTYRTIQETLREVTRCTRDRIVINTFMLERDLRPDRVRQPDDDDQQGPRLLRHARSAGRVHPGRLREQQAQADQSRQRGAVSSEQ